ncbi:MAG: hypothetical protein JEZ04_18710 [Spirochaetales bacterium]|nr:hypothetical protein [Spirochaetales bacterium]
MKLLKQLKFWFTVHFAVDVVFIAFHILWVYFLVRVRREVNPQSLMS